MGKATVTISHGQSQSFNLIEGSNIKLAPSSDGKGIEIGVTPSDTWINPGLATKNANGLLKQLPDDATKCLNGKGEWVDMPEGGSGNETTYTVFGVNKAGLAPGLPNDSDFDNENRWLRADGTWSALPDPTPCPKYNYKNVPHIVIDNIDCLSGSTFEEQSLTLRVYKNVSANTKTKVVNGYTYYYNTAQNSGYNYGRNTASIFVLKNWADKLLSSRYPTTNTTAVLDIVAGQMKGADGRYACTFYVKEGVHNTSGREYTPLYINDVIIKEFPAPTLEVSVWNAGNYPDVSEAGQICGWTSRADGGAFGKQPVASYSGLPFAMAINTRITYQGYPWLIWGTYMGSSGHDRSATLMFSAIIAEQIQQ